jgi:hypothetical protein
MTVGKLLELLVGKAGVYQGDRPMVLHLVKNTVPRTPQKLVHRL